MSFLTSEGHLFRFYDTTSRAFLGGVRAMSAQECGQPASWIKRPLRHLFDFDCFTGASLRSAAAAYDAYNKPELSIYAVQKFVLV